MLKIIILPSQAQDKRRESTQKETRFVAAADQQLIGAPTILSDHEPAALKRRGPGKARASSANPSVFVGVHWGKLNHKWCGKRLF
jgi:hypothetical protein